jgi:hypothetical protein
MKQIGKIILILLASTLPVPQGQAQDTAPVTNHFFGAAAMAIGQTTRVNIAQFDDPGEFPAGAACTIIIKVFGADGTMLTSPFRGQVGIGKTVFIDLNRNSLRASSNRVLFRAVVSSFEDPNEVPNPCTDIRATVEVYDNLTGRTMVFIGDPNQ